MVEPTLCGLENELILGTSSDRSKKRLRPLALALINEVKRVGPGVPTQGNPAGSPSVMQRPHGADAYMAVLVRGVSWRFVGGLVFYKNRPVAINEVEYQYLQNITDPVDFFDGDGRVLRRIRKFRFSDLDGKPVPLDDLPDVHLGAEGMDAAEAAELERRFEGDTRSMRAG